VLPDPTRQVEGKLEVAGFNVGWEVELGHEECHPFRIPVVLNQGVVFGHSRPEIEMPLAGNVVGDVVALELRSLNAN
jgi:hypothetical protein